MLKAWLCHMIQLKHDSSVFFIQFMIECQLVNGLHDYQYMIPLIHPSAF